MDPRTLRLTVAFTALAGLVMLSTPSPSLSQEDTAHLVLRKKVTAKGSPSVYIVQKGDNLSTIIRRKLGKPAAASPSVSRLVRKLNPQIRDVNLIYPGQKITLPRLAAEPGRTGYVVRKGDTLSAILHESLGVPAAEMAKWIGLTKKLNPGLADPNRIYPGQALILPDRGGSTPGPVEQAAGPAKADAPPMDALAFRPTDRDLDIIAAIVRQSGGTVARSGKMFIPLTEEEHLAVDCADIPMVELADGSRIFLDFGRQIPAATTSLVRSRWSNFAVLGDGGESVYTALAGIFGASRDYTFRRHEGALAIGTAPVLKLQADWVLFRKEPDGQERALCGVCRSSGKSQPLPGPVARFAEKHGVPVLEIDEGVGAVRSGQVLPSAPDIGSLDAGGNRALVGSLLEVLGYAYSKDQQIPVLDATKDTPPLVIRTDYAVKIGSRTVVIQFGDLPSQFQVKLNEKGMILVQIAGDDDRKTAIEKVLKGLDIPYVEENAEFSSLPEDERPPRWTLALAVIRLTSEKGTLYLVPPDSDRELCAFIAERWNRQIVRY